MFNTEEKRHVRHAQSAVPDPKSEIDERRHEPTETRKTAFLTPPSGLDDSRPRNEAKTPVRTTTVGSDGSRPLPATGRTSILPISPLQSAEMCRRQSPDFDHHQEVRATSPVKTNPETLYYASAAPGRARPLVLISAALLSPFIAVGVLICAELLYVSNPANRVPMGGLPAFLSCIVLIEILLLFAAFTNVILMVWYLSYIRAYAAAPWFVKTAIAILCMAIYAVAILGALFFVALMHMD